jgi:hypothetical protein
VLTLLRYSLDLLLHRLMEASDGSDSSHSPLSIDTAELTAFHRAWAESLSTMTRPSDLLDFDNYQPHEIIAVAEPVVLDDSSTSCSSSSSSSSSTPVPVLPKPSTSARSLPRPIIGYVSFVLVPVEFLCRFPPSHECSFVCIIPHCCPPPFVIFPLLCLCCLVRPC